MTITTKCINQIIDNRIIKGNSFWFNVTKVDFTTRRMNDETGEYWVKFHFPSGKEIRIKVDRKDLDELTSPFNFNNNGDDNGNNI